MSLLYYLCYGCMEELQVFSVRKQCLIAPILHFVLTIVVLALSSHWLEHLNQVTL